jgi:APA family basic amino acid/polyamine antiporter
MTHDPRASAKAFSPTSENVAPTGEKSPSDSAEPGLTRALGLFDMTMLVMGTVIGAGIFTVPYVVIGLVHSGELALGAWLVGGVLAISGGLVYAELAGRRPHVGGQYLYLREAYHPIVAFLYGWALLCVVQSGGMAAVAVIFGDYVSGFIHGPEKLVVQPRLYAAGLIALFTLINCLGVRAGGTTQNFFMLLKILAIGMLVICGLCLVPKEWTPFSHSDSAPTTISSWKQVSAFAAALVPVLFAYGGWHTATFVASEVKDAPRTLPRGLVLGVSGVILLYLAVNLVCLMALGPVPLADTKNPATIVMEKALGGAGAFLMSLAVALSIVGFVSQAILTSPRVYYVMAKDRLFLEQVAWVHPRTRVPIVAIFLQGAVGIIIAVSGTFQQIVNYVMSVELVFLALTALSLFAIRRHDYAERRPGGRWRGHPFTTLLFVVVNLAVLANLFYQSPENSAAGLGIAVAGVPVYFFWRAWYR